MKIIFSGGGTLGSVTPLLAIGDAVRATDATVEFLWVGTTTGPERTLVEAEGIRFVSLSSGKFRRYLSWWHVVDFFRIILGFFQSVLLLWRERPHVCISAGAFISVPLHAAARLLGIPTWIHQQDVRVGLANALMSPGAQIITTALEKQAGLFPKRKTRWLGNPVRTALLRGDPARAQKRFHLNMDLPVVFVTGGGTGSMRVNQLTAEAIPHLEGVCQIIHLSGRERPQEQVSRAAEHFPYYQVHQFFTDEMSDAYAVADVVVSRGGFGTLTEIAALHKAAILIPKPGHQDENVRFLADGGGAILMDERTTTGIHLAERITALLINEEERTRLGQRFHELLPTARAEDIIEIIRDITE